MAASDNKYKLAWVTGASSGIGKSIALALASQGYRVIASGRNQDALNELQTTSPNITALAVDITDGAQLETFASRLGDISDHLDLVILNAGVCEYLDFPDPDWDACRRNMDVNFFGAINCIKLALPFLRRCKTQRPQLVGIASLVTDAPFPRAEGYGASKAALQYFLSSLRIDLAADNIDVTSVNPGFVDTPLTRANDFEMPFLMDVDRAAERIVKNIQARPRNYSFPKRLRLMLGLSKLLPGLWQKMVSAQASRVESAGGDNP